MTDVTGQGCGKQADARVEIEGQVAGLPGGDDSHQFVGKMAVGLEEGSGADAVFRFLRLVSEMGGARGHENLGRRGFAVAGIGFAEGNDSGDLGQGRAKFLGPLADIGSAGIAGAGDVDQELRVVGVGEEFDFSYSLRNFSGAAALPESGDAAVDQRRTDGTLFDRRAIRATPV